jgi:hypothetical protein
VEVSGHHKWSEIKHKTTPEQREQARQKLQRQLRFAKLKPWNWAWVVRLEARFYRWRYR